MAPSERVLQWRGDAETGDAEAWFQLAAAYSEGAEGLAENEKLAVKMFLKAAEGGHGEAQHDLAVRLHAGIGVEQNHASAFAWFAKSAEQGCARAYAFMGRCHRTGRGVKQKTRWR